jgi:hypothetical protein
VLYVLLVQPDQLDRLAGLFGDMTACKTQSRLNLRPVLLHPGRMSLRQGPDAVVGADDRRVRLGGHHLAFIFAIRRSESDFWQTPFSSFLYHSFSVTFTNRRAVL